MNTHPNDVLSALEWAVTQAESSVDPIVRLANLPALRELRDAAKREAGK